jgi:hydrogenase maturation protease
VARALDGRLPWRVLVAHGLTPELADDLAACDHVIVVDAHVDAGLLRPTWRPAGVPPGIATASTPSPFAHTLDLSGLLALTATLHGRAPRATVMAMPARDVSLGETLSPRAAAGVDMATAALGALARRRAPPRLTT